MFWLLSDEYKRIWFKEREMYNKFQYAALETLAKEKLIERRYVKRKPRNNNQTRALPVINLKRFVWF